MPHFFINKSNIIDNIIKITNEELLNHLVNSRRVKNGEKVLFIDENKIQYDTTVITCQKKQLIAQINKSYLSFRILDADINVARCVLKPEADFSAIQKATELGVKTIIPLYSDNCALKEKVILSKMEKFQKIADESVKQCERADFPIIKPLKKLDDFLEQDIKNYNKVLVFSERAKGFGIKKFFEENKYVYGEKILAVIGCEGGFSNREFNLFEKYKLQEISLGKLILRADTALAAAIYGIIQEVTDVC